MKHSIVFGIFAVSTLSWLATGCGTEINTLRNPARLSRGASGVPPEVTSLTLTDASPTRNTPLALDWGIEIGSHTQYCLLENSTNDALCVWHSGSLPTTYVDSTGDGPIALSAFLKNDYGVSPVVTSNSITIDRTPADLASATITNANPTTTTAFGLSYGAVSHPPYTQYCILENNTAVGACSWVTGSLPATYTVTSVDGPKTLSIYLRDAAGNVSSRMDTGTVAYDGTAPSLAITSPAAGAYVNASNVSSYAVSGTCSENGRNVVISGTVSATVVCSGGAWTANLDFSAAPAGTVSITVNHSDAAGNAATPVSRSFTKDVVAPTVAITSPAAGSAVNLTNYTAFAISGTCSENGGTVVLSGDATASVTCSGGAWSANLNFTAAPSGTVTITANHSDAAGNGAAPDSRSFTKDIAAPTVAVTAPAAGTLINAGNVASFAVSGTCSENGRNVVITGDASATVTCTTGTWSANLDFSSAADGPVSITANHSDAAGNPATPSSRAFTKDVNPPAVAITSPAAGSYVNASNVSSFAVSGTCSDNGQNVVLSGDASATVVCTAGAWSANLNFTAAADGSVSITANHSDAASNAATPDSRSFTKDVGVPSLAITSPTAGSYINSSNVASFAVSGTCSENGRNVVITGDASATVTCTAGAWSANLDFTAAASGTRTITVNHGDAAGNAATPASRNFVKDVATPTVAVSAPAAGSYVNASNVSSFAVNGTCSENGQNVVLSGSVSATVACSSGTWSTNLDFSAVADGSVSITVNHSSAAGNAATPDTRSFTKDVGAPTVAITSPAAGSYINASNVASFTVSGTCSENGRNVAISGTVSATATCTAGAWSANLDFTSAAAGAVTVNVNHSDAAGNAAPQDSRSYTKDAVAPTLAISTPAAGSYVNASNVSSFAVTGTCSENGRNVVITGDASATVTCTAGAWSANLDFTSAAAGTVTISVDHSDAAGNAATTVSRSFTKDAAAPTVAISTPAAGAFVTAANAASFAVTGTCTDSGQNVVITGDASATVACTAGAWSANLDFSSAADGAVSIAVNHSDAAGNAATPATRSFTKDVGVPTVAITSPAAGTYVNAANVLSFAVTGTCSETGQNVVVTGAASATVSCLAGAWTANLDFSAAAQGSVTIYANHADAAGNPATQDSRAFTKDTVLPTVAITSPAANSSITAANAASFAVSGTCSENGRAITFTGDGIGTATCSSGTWSANLDFSAATDGAVTAVAHLDDAAGNSATPDSRAFMKDTSPPTITTDSAVATINSTGTASRLIYFTGADTISLTAAMVTLGTSGTVSCSSKVITPIDATTKRVDISGCTGDGNVWVSDISAGAASDNAGNQSAAWASSANKFTVDNTAPTVASATILNTSPTPSRGYLLNWGTVTDTIAQYCINEANTVGTCSWVVASSLPASYTVSAAQGAKTLYVWLKDAVGNTSAMVTSNTVTYTNVLTISNTSTTITKSYSFESIEGKKVGVRATLLNDGRVLLTGGCFEGATTKKYYHQVKIYDPTTGKFSLVKPMITARCFHQAVKLSDGKVLVMGGMISGANTSTNAVEVFDPSTGRWYGRSPMGTARAYHTATLYTSNKILVAGGNTGTAAGTQSSTEIYDVSNNVWLTGPTMSNPRMDHQAVILPSSGDVLLIGGLTNAAYSKTVDRFTPSGHTGTIAAKASMGTLRREHRAHALTAAQSGLAGDAVIVFGGRSANTTYLNTTELYDVTNDTWTAKATMSSARAQFSSVQYPDGSVFLFAGKSASSTYPTTTELYVPSTNTYTAGPAINAGRNYPFATLLSDNDRIFTGYGGTDDQFSQFALSYKKSTNAWTQLDFLYMTWNQTGGINFSASGGRAVHCFGGDYPDAGINYNRCAIYEPTYNNIWYTSANPQGTGGPQSCAVELTNGKFLITGADYYPSITKSLLYDPSTDTWSQTGTKSRYIGNCSAVRIPGGKVLVTGYMTGSAYNTGGPDSRNFIYTESTNTWADGAARPGAQAGGYMVKTPTTGRIFSIGGWTGSAISNALYEFDTGTNTWVTRASMPTAVHGFAAGATDIYYDVAGAIYVYGGCTASDCSTYISTLQKYDINTDTWSVVTPAGTPPTYGSLPYSAFASMYVIGWSTYDMSFHNFPGYTNTSYTITRAGDYYQTTSIGHSTYGVNMGYSDLSDTGMFVWGLAGQNFEELHLYLHTQPYVRYTVSGGDGDYSFSTSGTSIGTFYPDTRTYIPSNDSFVSGTVTVTVQDGSGQSASATITK